MNGMYTSVLMYALFGLDFSLLDFHELTSDFPIKNPILISFFFLLFLVHNLEYLISHWKIRKQTYIHIET